MLLLCYLGLGLFGSMKAKIAKKFNPDAHVVNLEADDEKPVYDEKLKRWIFPGDDPAEIAKPLPPPPKIPLNMNSPSTETKSSAPSDPLGNLMAPPPRRAPGGASRITARSRYPDAMASIGAVKSSGSSSKMPPKTGSKPPTAPPKFTVFQPKPSSESEQKET